MEDLMVKEVLFEVIENERKDLPFSLTVSDLQEMLPLSDTRIYELLITGEIPGKKIGGKWVITTSKFLAWVHSNEKKESKIEQEVKV